MNRKLIAAVCALAMTASVSTAFAEKRQEPSHAPEAVNLELETYRNTAVGGVLSATDPDGDTLTFTLTTEPMKGSVEVCEDGTFTYTPGENKKGKDYFGFKATDPEGNTSEEGTVLIRIQKQKTGVTYADLDGRAEGCAAVTLAEQGVYVGSCVAGNWLFGPDQAVSRGEFLAMCLAASGEPVLRGVMSTGFGDDTAIPAWAKNYVSTGRMYGTVCGYSDGTRIVFDCDRPITHAEAAVILDRLMKPEAVSFTLSEAVPAWAEQAVANLTARDLYPVSTGSEQPLTRAECAVMLVKTMDAMG